MLVVGGSRSIRCEPAPWLANRTTLTTFNPTSAALPQRITALHSPMVAQLPTGCPRKQGRAGSKTVGKRPHLQGCPGTLNIQLAQGNTGGLAPHPADLTEGPNKTRRPGTVHDSPEVPRREAEDAVAIWVRCGGLLTCAR